MSHYLIPAINIKSEEVIKGSQFITRTKKVDSAQQAKLYIKELKNRFPDASHHCWAYVVGDPKSTTLIGCSDDGEPSGTAGKPMLHVLQHALIGDIVIVCTRYFGGTKLGTGGLARAYGGGVKLALKKLPTKNKIHYSQLKFTLGYSNIQDCEHLVKSYNSQNQIIDYDEEISVSIEIATIEVDAFKKELINLCKGKIKWKKIRE